MDEVKTRNPSYHCRPVAPFGAHRYRFLIVGLAPGMHGANATGRPFTGDHAGILLYDTLHRHGFASLGYTGDPEDGLELFDCRITNAVKCLPPGNKPIGQEVAACNRYLQTEISALPKKGLVLALGAVAHSAVLKACGRRASSFRFGHGAVHPLPADRYLLDSYHCSRYNTQTGRLTAEMFDRIFRRATDLLDADCAH